MDVGTYMEKVKICFRLWPWVMNLWVSEKQIEIAKNIEDTS